MATITKEKTAVTDTAKPRLLARVGMKIDAFLNQRWMCTMFDGSASALFFQGLLLAVVIPLHAWWGMDRSKAFLLPSIGGPVLAGILFFLRRATPECPLRYQFTTVMGIFLLLAVQCTLLILFRDAY